MFDILDSDHPLAMFSSCDLIWLGDFKLRQLLVSSSSSKVLDSYSVYLYFQSA